ncbi:MAG: 50S ribosomal protein L25/general stress protein Ctc [Bacteroidetes bacterium GWF2_43_63]|nr:MAG: 50S ribosomal protein L25/general stress protein Ctc [Bacteroidetes bacterium GWE2_42_42]OFY54167.1 MAG: 50S ribosomal protein L25/general stress protein Ctc [Bacteroidetes bacterium GWF2_43_63]HBG70792.1 50S ribosomal protein L25 [Bacteroidales bacterium]HCB61696.1 50S ribosomal protein L25 [Bacteroidales bacterium]HCY22072.1 50S ribosomal protein L25 [Bacteroidales bacterium]
MRTVSMSGSLRGDVGKKDAKRLRKEGLVPCVLYGQKEQIHFFTQEKQFKDVIYTPNACFVELSIDGHKHNALLQEVQYHPVSDNILHVDFYEYAMDKPVSLSIPVGFVGTSPGVLKGGKMQQKVRKIKVTALPDKMPEKVTIDITPLDINDAVRVKDIVATDFKINLPENNVLLIISPSRNVVEETPGAEAAAAPAAAAAKK